MKKLILLILTITFLLFSCETEKTTLDGNSVDKDMNENFNNFTKATIGFSENGNLRISVSNEKIMSVFKKFVIMNRLNLEVESFNLLVLDNRNFLRFYSKENKVSTVELIVNNQNKIIVGNTICTSIACASGGGCLPDANGVYCTPCIIEGVQPPNDKGDCSRSTGS